MKLTNLLRTALVATTMIIWSNVGWGQQIIGSFPQMDGGYENQSGTLATASTISSEQTAWTTQIANAGVIYNTGGRSGQKFVQYTQSGTTHRRLQSPTAGLSASTSYVVQFYYQGDLDGTIAGDNLRTAVSAAGTGSPGTYSTYLNSVNTGLVWTKYTAVVSTSGTTPTFGLGIISVNNTAQFNIDDFVIYAGSAVDETAPNSPGTVTVNNATTSTLDVSWVAADGGVDGGGYVVVRFASDPGSGNNPNQNGIYAVGNTIPTGGTVRYIGTDLTFTDTELAENTDYWYKVYTVDKAFNYSDASTGTGKTSGGVATPTITVTPVSLSGFSYFFGSGPSGVQSFTVSGADLTENLIVEVPTMDSDYEFSLDDPFEAITHNISRAPVGGVVAETPIYVRLIADLAVGTYNQNVNITSTDADSKVVALSGSVTPATTVDWCNLQWPASDEITEGGTFNVYAQAYEDGVTSAPGATTDLDCWIGYNATNTDPSTWTNWVVATFNTQSGNNDEFVANIATGLEAGTYYYASRFQYLGGPYTYGGYNGGFWDGSTNVSGVLTVNAAALITVEHTELTGFTYQVGEGPSSVQGYMLYGSNLTSGIQLTTPDNYEISLDIEPFTPVVNPLIPQSEGSISQAVYVRLKSGLSVGAYNESISHTSEGAVEKTVSLSGSVTPVPVLLISEYLEGLSNNKAIEIYNPSAEAVDLNGYTVRLASNGGGWGTTQALSGSLPAGEVFVIANASAVQAILDVADITSTVTYFNGDDAVGLFFNGVLIDIFGNPDLDPGTGWPVAGVNNVTVDHTIVRKFSIVQGNTDWQASFGTTTANSEWIVFSVDDFTRLGSHSFISATINPITGAFDYASPGNVSTTITWYDATSVTEVSYLGVPLTLNIDYTLENSTLTILSSYIDGAVVGDLELTIKFNGGDDATLTITVSDTRPRYPVTFTVDMSEAINKGLFEIGTHEVDVAGNFNNWGDPVVNLTREGGTNNYTYTTGSNFLEDQTISFKFRINGALWESGSNRQYTVNSVSNTVEVAFRKEIGWANLQYPDDGEIDVAGEYIVYSRVYIGDITNSGVEPDALDAWIGYSTANAIEVGDFEGAGWTWVPATFATSGVDGDNDEYTVDLGAAIADPAAYFYVSRFKYGNDPYIYGGFNGGYWDGATNVSGTLTVNITDSYKVAVDKNELTFDDFGFAEGEDYNNIKSNFTVPVLGDEYLSTIAWESSETDVIAINEGIATVTRPLPGTGKASGVPVDLTATITNGGAFDTKVMSVLVKEDLSSFEVALAVDGDKTAGVAFNLSITNAQDIDGLALADAINVTVTSNQADGVVFNTEATFTAGAATINITLTSVALHELTVNVAGVFENKTLGVNVIAAPEFSISLTIGGNPIEGTVVFAQQIEGYDPVAEKTVTITRAGDGDITNLLVALSGDNSTDFTITQPDPAALSELTPTTTFTVKPNNDLAVGTYTATVTVTADNDVEETFDVSFTVIAATYTISLDAEDPTDFGVAVLGYSPIAAETITITKTGNSNITNILVELSGDNFEDFEITQPDPAELVGAVTQTTFTVKPVNDLGLGVYSAMVTVTANNEIEEIFQVVFEVVEPTYTIELDAADPLDFGTLVEGYEPITPETITITKTGNSDITNLMVVLFEGDDESFELGALGATTLDADNPTTTFTVKPLNDLPFGTYSTTVLVTADNGVAESFGVTFTVIAYAIELDAADPLVFTSQYIGYEPVVAETVTITRIGNGNIIGLDVDITAGDIAAFVVTQPLLVDLMNFDTETTFTVKPADDLEVGAYAATVTVTAENEVSESFVVEFEVMEIPSTEAQIISFSFAEQTGPAIIGDGTIAVEVASGTVLTNLIATFTLSDGASAKVGEVVQVSGVTANDFSSDVTYIVTAEDGETTKNWVVTVTEAVPVLIAYSTGFESSEGFVASTTYNNTTIKYDGPVGQKWGIYHGTVSINNVISGSQSLQMRWYLASPANLGYAFTNFDISNPTKVTFKAKRAAQVIGVTVSYSIDGGTSYVNGQTYSLTTTATDYTYIISESGEFSNVRLKFQLSFTTNPTDRADLIIDNIEVQGMDSPPVPTFFPVSGAIDVPLNVNPTITFNEPIFLSGVAVENADLAGLITFEDGAAQPVNFNATISGTVITVVLVSDLDYSTEYTLTIAPVEDEAGNPMLTSASASFTTVVYIPSDDATLSVFELGSESVLGLTGILVADPENDPGATLYVDDFGTFIGILVETTDANATVEVTINSVAVDEEDYGTQVFMADNIVLATVTAEDGTTKKYYKVTLLGENRVLTLTAPVGGETYNTGDEIVITWTYENIANVNLWAYNGVSEELHQLNESPIAALEGTFSFNISNGIAGDYFIRITDASDADFYNQSASEITIVDNVAPSIEELFPENNATDVSTSFTLSITFDESIVKGTGNLTIHKVADNSVVATFTQDVVTVDHDIVTVDVVGLDFGTAYYINIQAGMFVDVSGNPNAAISNNSTWTFTTVEEPANDLFFSEYIEGTSNNKALEIYNPTNQNADLSLYVIKSANNGNGWGNTLDGPDTRYVLPLTGSLAPGEVLVIANALASQDILDEADIELTYNSTINGCDGCNVLAFNGDDAIGLFINDELIDVIGIPTEDPGTNWPVAGTGATSEFTLVRKSTVITGNTDWLVSAGTNAENSEWIVYPQNTFDYLGWHGELIDNDAPVATFAPLNGATDVALNVTPTISFDEPVRNLDDSEITDGNLGDLLTFTDGAEPVAFTASINVGKTIITVTPAASLLKGVTYTLTLASVEDDSGNATAEQSVSFTTILPSTVATLATFEIGSTNALALEAIEVASPEDAGAELFVAELVGLSVTATDPNATVTVKKNGDIVEPAAYAALTYVAGDVILVTVVAEDGITTKYYKVTLTDTASDQTDILTYSIAGQVGDALLGDGTIAVVMPFGTDVTELIANFTLSNGASVKVGEVVQVSGETVNDFTLPVTYVVTAEDGVTTNDWVVTVTLEAGSTEADILTFSFAEQTGPAIIGDGTIAVEVASGTVLTNLIATFTLSDGASAKVGEVVQVSGVTANDFSSDVTYILTAEDGETTKNWVVTVTEAVPVLIAYSTGFESSEGFVASTTYNNTTIKYDGPVGQKWGIYHGTVSTNNVISGSQSLQMRWYLASPANLGYAFTNFDISNPTKVTFKAKRAAQVIGVTVSYSIDGGTSYVNGQTYSLTTTASDYTYIISESGEFSNVRLKFQLSFTTNPTDRADLIIDNIEVQGMDSPPVPTFFPVSGAIDVPLNVHPSITFNKPVFIDGEAIEDADLAGLITFVDGESQAVAFNATIVGKLITVVPSAELNYSTTYTLTIAPVEDAAGNAMANPASTTFTTVAYIPSDDAALSVFELGGIDVLTLNGILVGDPQNDAGASLYVEDFMAFVGIEAATNDANAMMSVAIDGVLVPADNYTTQTFEDGDVVLATVIAEDETTTKYYKVTLTSQASSEADFQSYSIAGQVGGAVINFETEAISVTVPFGTNTTALIATFTLSEGATAKVGEVVQVSGETPNDFTEPVTYVITAQDGITTKEWTVTVTVESGSTEADILTFSFAEQTGPATLGDGTIAIEVANGTLLTNLVATFTLSEGASAKVGEVVQESGVTSNDFSSDVTYIVTAQDGETTKDWVVTVIEEEEDLSVAIFTETMGTVSATTTIAAHETANGFDNDGFTMSGNADVRNTTPSTGYENASGVANIFFGTAGGINNRDFVMAGINTLNYSDITLSFGVLSTVANNMLTVEYSTDGTTFTPLTVDNTIELNTWALKQASGNIPSSETLTLRFSKNSTTQFRLDDVRMRGVFGDSNPPVPTFLPVSGAIDIPLDVQPTITFNEPIFVSEGVAVTNDNVNSIITFVDGESQAVAFNATIDGLVITVVPGADLAYSTTYTLTIAPVEDAAGNAMETSASATFTTVAYVPSNDATLSLFKLGGVDALLLGGVVVTDPETDEGATLWVEDLVSFIGIEVSPTDDLASVTITVNGVVVAEGDYETQTFEDADIVLATVVAEDAETTIYYKVNVQIDDRELELTLPVGGETFYAGQDLTFTWTSANIEFVNLWTFDGENLSSINQTPIDASLGTFTVNIPNGVNGTFFIRITDASDATFYSQSVSEITVIDELNPSIEGTYPLDGAIDMPLSFTLFIEFDENIAAGEGNFIIHKLSDDSEFITVASSGFAINHKQVSYNVQGLEYETSYYVTAPEGLFDDISGNPSPAITKDGDIKLHFTTVEQPTAELFFSEYIEGSVGSNKAIEIYNPFDVSVDLSVYSVKLYPNGATNPTQTQVLSGTLSPGDVYVIVNSGAVQEILDVADISSAVTFFNGDDALGLYKNNELIDVFGIIGTDPGDAWVVAGVANATKDHTLIRKLSVTKGTTDWAISAGTNEDNSQWIVLPDGTHSYLGWHGEQVDTQAPVATFTPADQTINVPIDVIPTISFNEPIRNIDNSEITNENVAALIEFTFGENQVEFNASINEGKTLITITPTENLLKGFTYTLSILPVEDESDNATVEQSVSFTTILPNSVATLAAFEIGGTNVLILEGIEVANPEDAGAELFVAELVGLSVTATDPYATVTVMKNGDIVEPADYAALTYVAGDVILVTVVAENGETTKYYKVTLSDTASDQADILTYSIAGQVGNTVLGEGTIAVVMPFGTDVTELIANFTLSYGATATVGEVSQVSGVTPNNFTESVAYVVTAQDGVTTNDWVVTVTVEAGSTEAEILTFSFAEQTGPATLGDGTIAIEVANGTLLTSLVATFTLSEGASAKVGEVVQESGVTANDFSSDVTYIVTAEDGETTKNWVVTVTEEEEDLSVAIFTETMGTVSATTTIAAHETANGFDNDGFTMSGNADVRSTTPSTGYENASGVANIFFGTAGGINNRDFVMAGINTLNYTDITLSFGVLSTVANNMLTVEYSTDGTTFTPLTVDNTIALNTWALKQASGNIPSSETLTLRFSKNSTTQFRLDDVRMRGVYDDSNPPVPTFFPVSGAIDVPLNVHPTITFNKPIFIGGVAVTNDNINSLITFVDSETQAVAFNATIEGLVITIVPEVDLTYSTAYTLTIAPVEDEEGNVMAASASATFTTVAYVPSNDATLSLFNIGEVNVLLLNGIVVTDPETELGATLYTEDISSLIGIMVTTNDANALVTITINGVVVAADDYATQTFGDGDIILATVVAEDETTTMYYKVNVQFDDRELELTYPVGGETFYAGQTITFMWTSANINNLNIWAYDAVNQQLHLLNEEGPIVATAGTFIYNINNGISGLYFIRITDASDASFFDQTASEIIVIDELVPEIIGLFPNNGAVDVPITFNLRIEFDEVIDHGTGNFIINKLIDDSPVLTVTSQNFNLMGNAAILQVQGLDYETAYYITSVEGVFVDNSGNPSLAITKEGAIQWHFTTMEEPQADLFFSEYIEGTSNNKALEIYNPTGQTVDLSLYVVKSANNGNGWGNTADGPDTRYVLPLTGTLAPGEVLVIANAQASQDVLDEADITLTYNSTVNGCDGCNVLAFNGDDAVGLFNNDVLIDVIGVPDVDPGTNWPVAGTGATSEFTLVRKSTVITGNTDWLASAGTNADDSEWIVFPQNTFEYLGWHLAGLNDEAEILAFAVENQMGETLIDSEAATITIEVLNGTNLAALIPTFSLSMSATAYVDGIEQVSGTSVVNFTSSVLYTVVAEDGINQKVWTVTITEAAVSTEAEILSFAVVGQIGSSIINSQAASVEVQVVFGTDIANLVPTINISLGAIINPNSGTAQDFTNPVVYTVTAQDGVTTKDWTVTVNVASIFPIYDIQFTDHPSGASPFEGEVITTSGIVTAWHYNFEGGTFQGIFIQDGEGAWNGLYVFNPQMNPIPAVGDSILVTGIVKEYYGLTELTFDALQGVEVEITNISSGLELPAPAIVTTAQANEEAWESVLIRVLDVLCTNDNSGFGMAEINDGSGPLKVDDDMHAAALVIDKRYNITGIGHYSYSEYKILPRSAEDVELLSSVLITWGENINAYPNPFSNIIWIDNAYDASRVLIFNLLGQQVLNVNLNGEMRATIHTDGLPFGVYLITVVNDKGNRIVRKMIKK